MSTPEKRYYEKNKDNIKQKNAERYQQNKQKYEPTYCKYCDKMISYYNNVHNDGKYHILNKKLYKLEKKNKI